MSDALPAPLHLVQLDRGEGRHQFARLVFTQQAERTAAALPRKSGGPEDQLGALGLVVSVIVFWNTIYTDAALKLLRVEDLDVRDEDVARLY